MVLRKQVADRVDQDKASFVEQYVLPVRLDTVKEHLEAMYRNAPKQHDMEADAVDEKEIFNKATSERSGEFIKLALNIAFNPTYNVDTGMKNIEGKIRIVSGDPKKNGAGSLALLFQTGDLEKIPFAQAAHKLDDVLDMVFGDWVETNSKGWVEKKIKDPIKRRQTERLIELLAAAHGMEVDHLSEVGKSNSETTLRITKSFMRRLMNEESIIDRSIIEYQ